MYNELYHYGVKGMHWGIRNSETLARYRRGSSNGGIFRIKQGPLTAKQQRRREQLDRATNRTVKQGKDKPNISPAEKITKDTKTVLDSSKKLRSSYKTATTRLGLKDEAKKMSNEDLNKAIRRMQLEKQYVDLKEQDLAPGKSKVDSMLDTIGTLVTIGGAVVSAYQMYKQIKG